MSTWDEFVQAAMRVAQEENYPIGVILGQAAVETGRNPNNAMGNNWFGIKGQGTAGWNSLRTQEADQSGNFYPTLSNFAAYNTLEDGIRAYINLIKTNYPNAYALKDNPASMVSMIKQGGYATDPNYVQKVISTPEFNGQISQTFQNTQQNKPQWQQIADSFMNKFAQPVQAQEVGGSSAVLRPPPNQSQYTTQNMSPAQPPQNLAPGESPYTVKPGDTLWDIANKYLGSGSRWHEIGGFTGLPTQLPIGQQLTIPNRSPQGFYDYSAMSRPTQNSTPSPVPTPQPQRTVAPMSPAVQQPQGFYNYGAMSSQNMSPAQPYNPPISTNYQSPYGNIG